MLAATASPRGSPSVHRTRIDRFVASCRGLRRGVVRVLLAALFAGHLLACTTPASDTAHHASADANGKSSRFPIVDMSDVMKAKLVYTEAIVNGLARGDLPLVAENAAAMRELSERASWMVHDTVTYLALSDTFRTQLGRMETHARAGDAAALVEDYVAVTNTCLACHVYLQRERRSADMPGRLSGAETPSPLQRIALRR